MGAFKVQFEIANRDGDEFVSVEAMVDTGATYSFLPRNLLRRLEVEPRERRVFLLADETEVQYDMGEALFRIDGHEYTAPVVFAPDGVGPLLGVTALEVFGLGVDPVNERLVRVPGFLKRVEGRPLG